MAGKWRFALIPVAERLFRGNLAVCDGSDRNSPRARHGHGLPSRILQRTCSSSGGRQRASPLHQNGDGSGFKLPFEKLGRRGIHLGPAGVAQEIMNFIGNDEFLEWRPAAAQFGG